MLRRAASPSSTLSLPTTQASPNAWPSTCFTATGTSRSVLSAGWLSRGLWDALLWTVFVLVLAEPLIANQIFKLRQARAAKSTRRAA